MKKNYCFLMLLVLTYSFSQEGENESEKFQLHHSITALLSHSMIKNAIREGKTDWIAFPYFCIRL